MIMTVYFLIHLLPLLGVHPTRISVPNITCLIPSGLVPLEVLSNITQTVDIFRVFFSLVPSTLRNVASYPPQILSE